MSTTTRNEAAERLLDKLAMAMSWIQPSTPQEYESQGHRNWREVSDAWELLLEIRAELARPNEEAR